MYLTLLFDVEDIISPAADDVTEQIARIVTETGLSATFCVVGERARQWRARGRGDVVAALARHDIGYHTDYHSVHPTVVEYLAGKDWCEGVEESLRRERPGVEAVREVFDTTPSCFGGPGNTWGPQINEAMSALGVPSIVYAHTRVPGGDVHRFAGSIMYPGGLSAGDSEYHLPGRWELNLRRLEKDIREAAENGVQWIEVFAGHPSRILHEAFWDGEPFAGGRSPPRTEWKPPQRKSEAELQIALSNLRQTLLTLRDIPGVEIRTIREMNSILGDADEIELDKSEIEEARRMTNSNLAAIVGWPILPVDIDTDGIRQLTKERMSRAKKIILRPTTDTPSPVSARPA